ncbi:ferrochelatase [Ramlibacter tataouinensis]|uniref:ferrochelatase n=1 Tax=Ramlibacter tataouinensis TaxID=94132 RepID=UPI0022F3F642|nr:ferrochelatase [Ramlibacter tataouinensis]WBY01615.1 ferrochelatase [Ramlibacter tataouinensis]
MAFSSRFRSEPPVLAGGHATGTGVLLCNLGTPEQPTAAAVRSYLREFLSDPRVVEIPRAAWLPLLYGVVLPLRPAKSAAKYASIWSNEGSPLQVWTERQAKLLQGWLGEAGHRVKVRHAMRYGRPSIAAQLDALKAEGAGRILVLCAYPQYSGTTTASVLDAVGAWSARTRHVPEIRFVTRFFDDRGYIDALAARVEAYWREHGRPGHFVMSFHGVPERTVRLGDPYRAECEATARLLAGRLGLAPAAWTLSFQSRFGRAKWLEPYTEPTLRALGRQGVERVDVACPGFVADCLETLEEIAQEGRHAFLGAGGKAFHYIPCVNAEPAWTRALGEIAARNLAGWPTQAA